MVLNVASVADVMIRKESRVVVTLFGCVVEVFAKSVLCHATRQGTGGVDMGVHTIQGQSITNNQVVLVRTVKEVYVGLFKRCSRWQAVTAEC